MVCFSGLRESSLAAETCATHQAAQTCRLPPCATPQERPCAKSIQGNRVESLTISIPVKQHT